MFVGLLQAPVCVGTASRDNSKTYHQDTKSTKNHGFTFGVRKPELPLSRPASRFLFLHSPKGRPSLLHFPLGGNVGSERLLFNRQGSGESGASVIAPQRIQQ